MRKKLSNSTCNKELLYTQFSCKCFFVSRTKNNEFVEDLVKTHKQTLIKLIAFISTLGVFNIKHVQDYTIILLNITLDDTLTEISIVLGDIFGKLQHLGAINEVAFLSNLILER